LGKLVLFKNKRATGLTLIFSLDIAASTAGRSVQISKTSRKKED